MATIVTRTAKGSPLTHAELDANFTNLNAAFTDDTRYSTAILADKPVAYWRLNEDYTATTYADSSGNGYSLTPVNAKFLPVPGPQPNPSSMGAFTPGGSSAAYATFPSALYSTWPATQTYSIEASAFFSPQAVNSWHPVLIFAYASGSNNGQLRLSMQTNANWIPYFALTNTSGTENVVSVSRILPVGMWHHFVVTATGSVLCLYVNGKLFTSMTQTVTTEIISRAYGGLMHSQYSGDTPSSAAVSEVSLYNYTLTAAQVAAHYALLRRA